MSNDKIGKLNTISGATKLSDEDLSFVDGGVSRTRNIKSESKDEQDNKNSKATSKNKRRSLPGVPGSGMYC